jgi:hypothetical protein
LLLLVRNLRQNAKLVLGARPSGSGSIAATLSIRFDVRQVKRFRQLERVGHQSVREIALEVLAPDHTHYAAALAAVFRDDTEAVKCLHFSLLISPEAEFSVQPSADVNILSIFLHPGAAAHTVVH